MAEYFGCEKSKVYRQLKSMEVSTHGFKTPGLQAKSPIHFFISLLIILSLSHSFRSCSPAGAETEQALHPRGNHQTGDTYRGCDRREQ